MRLSLVAMLLAAGAEQAAAQQQQQQQQQQQKKRNTGFHPRVPHSRASTLPSTANCTERFANITADHFSWTVPVDVSTAAAFSANFPLRYFINIETWGGPGFPVWMYLGNEADVEQYVNATGLMWENAA